MEFLITLYFLNFFGVFHSVNLTGKTHFMVSAEYKQLWKICLSNRGDRKCLVGCSAVCSGTRTRLSERLADTSFRVGFKVPL
jgi:hypothetical protein